MNVQNPAVNTAAITTKPAHIHAPAESVEQFRTLLTSMTNSLQNSSPVLSQQQKPEALPQGNLLEDTSNRLHKADIALEELSWEIRKAGQQLGKAMPMSGLLPGQIMHMKYASTAYFTNLMRTESGFSSLSEEVQAITKKRG
ncbi:hypothetical protein [Limnobacter sp.]|uniref:hypothetical protein n=1 Tax=Limnobacter sp. TaxID=2003368 RepID=UPI0035127E40